MDSNIAIGIQSLSGECASHTTRSLRSLVIGWLGSTSIPRKAIRKQLEALNQRVTREVHRHHHWAHYADVGLGRPQQEGVLSMGW